MELLESLADDEVDGQDAQAEIAQEKGWSKMVHAGESPIEIGASLEEADVCSSYFPEAEDASEPTESIRAYSPAYVVGLEVMLAVQTGRQLEILNRVNSC